MREESLKSELATATTESARLCSLFDSTREEMVHLQEKLAARDIIATSFVESTCARLGTSFRGVVEIFFAGFSKSVSEPFHVGSIYYQIHANTAINGIVLRFPGGTGSKDGGRTTQGEDVIVPLANPEVIELYIMVSL